MWFIMSLPLGKVSIKILRKILGYVKTDTSVIVTPGVGIDAAIVSVGEELIVSACDPITGASREVGWLSVHVNANDIAVCAAYPRWYVVTLLLPPRIREEDIYDVMEGINNALSEIGANLISGHTEVTNKVTDTIVVGTMIGIPMVKGKYVTNRGARDGDYIIMTKGAGIEGTWILAESLGKERGLSESEIRRIRALKNKISVLPDVKVLMEIGVDNIHAMHDATEGGVLGALYEMAEASDVGFRVYEDKIIVREETKKIASLFSLDPLKLISSGTLIAAIDGDFVDKAINLLRKGGIDACVIGEITKGNREIIKDDGSVVILREPPIDELWRILGSSQ